MNALQPLSEDFLYWNPEEICRYPVESGIEDGWFNQGICKKIHTPNERAGKEASDE